MNINRLYKPSDFITVTLTKRRKNQLFSNNSAKRVMKLERDFYGKVAKGNVAQKGLRKPLKVTFPKLPKKPSHVKM